MVNAGSAPKTACAINPAKLAMEMIFFIKFCVLLLINTGEGGQLS
jgi:hypothetical protein